MKKVVLLILTLLTLVLFLSVILTRPERRVSFEVGSPRPPGDVDPQLISTWDIGILLAPDGSLWGWGRDRGRMMPKRMSSRPLRLAEADDWVQVAASQSHIIGIKSDGSLWGWGSTRQGQLAISQTNHLSEPTQIGTDTDWAEIRSGSGHCLALKSDGTLWAWGQNDHGQIGDGTRTNRFSPQLISKTSDWKQIGASGFASLGLKTDGTLWGWGFAGPLSADVLVPTQLHPAADWTAIAPGDYHILALRSDGTLWAQGPNAHVTARDDFTSDRTKLFQVGEDSDWTEIYSGSNCFYARKTDGSWWACGNNRDHSLGLRPDQKHPVDAGSPQPLPFDFEPWAFAVGNGTTLLLTRDGALWSWGERLGTSGENKAPWIVRLFRSITGQKPPTIRQTDALVDARPYKIWQLPKSD